MTISMFLQAGLLAACLALATYCHVLARRLRRLNDLETGLGGAIAVMSVEVARLEAAIAAARSEAEQAARGLAAEIQQAKDERMRLRLGQELGAPEGSTRIRRVRRKMPTAVDSASDRRSREGMAHV